jgi:molybdate transport system regulatory protein
MRIWKRTVKSVLTDERLREAVVALFADQRRFITGSRLGSRGKLWFEIDKERPVGPALARLLEEIDRLGTLSKAVASIRISYEHAWSLIKEAETNLGKKLVVPLEGSSGGGRSELSPDGHRLLDIFRRINSEVPGHGEPHQTDELDPELEI